MLEFAGEPTEAELTLVGRDRSPSPAIAVLAALIGIALAARVYLQRKARAVEPAILAHGWYYDESIAAFMGGPGRAGFDGVTAFDETVVDGAVNGVGTARARERLAPPRRPDRLRPQLRPRHRRRRRHPRRPPPHAGADCRDGARRHAEAHASSFDLLSTIVAVPAVGAVLVALVSRRRPELCRQLAVLVTLVTGALTIWLLLDFQTGTAARSSTPPTTRGSSRSASAGRVGVDGISLFLVVLTGVLFPIAIVGADPHHDHKPYYAWLLLLEAGCLGVFVALDLFLFFVMFEIVLVPMYFLIGGWGYGERVYAAIKFFLFTMLGSAFMLVSILALAFLHQQGVRRRPHLRPRADRRDHQRQSRPRPPAGSSSASPSPSPSRCRCSRCTPGCPTPTPRRRPPAR